MHIYFLFALFLGAAFFFAPDFFVVVGFFFDAEGVTVAGAGELTGTMENACGFGALTFGARPLRFAKHSWQYTGRSPLGLKGISVSLPHSKHTTAYICREGRCSFGRDAV